MPNSTRQEAYVPFSDLNDRLRWEHRHLSRAVFKFGTNKFRRKSWNFHVRPYNFHHGVYKFRPKPSRINPGSNEFHGEIIDLATQDVTCGPGFETSRPGVIAFGSVSEKS